MGEEREGKRRAIGGAELEGVERYDGAVPILRGDNESLAVRCPVNNQKCTISKGRLEKGDGRRRLTSSNR